MLEFGKNDYELEDNVFKLTGGFQFGTKVNIINPEIIERQYELTGKQLADHFRNKVRTSQVVICPQLNKISPKDFKLRDGNTERIQRLHIDNQNPEKISVFPLEEERFGFATMYVPNIFINEPGFDHRVRDSDLCKKLKKAVRAQVFTQLFFQGKAILLNQASGSTLLSNADGEHTRVPVGLGSDMAIRSASL